MLTRPLFKSTFENIFSMQFDGVDEYLNYGDVGNFDRLDPFSFFTWYKPSVNGTRQYLISKFGAAPILQGLQFFKETNNKLFLFFVADNGLGNLISVSGNSSIINPTFRHVVVTYDGSSLASGFQIYLDAVADTMVVGVDNLSAPTANTIDLNISRSNLGSNHVNGFQDEFAYYDKRLTQIEVNQIYNLGKPKDLRTLPTSSNLALWSRFTQIDKDNFPIIADHSGNGLSGTAVNMESSDIVADVP